MSEERKRNANAIREYTDRQEGRYYKDVIRDLIEEFGSVKDAARVIPVSRVSLHRFTKRHDIRYNLKRRRDRVLAELAKHGVR